MSTEEPAPPILVIAQTEIDRSTVLDLHHHPDHLIAWSATATVTIRTDGRDWLLPPTHALWIPAGTAHMVTALRPGRGYGVLLDPHQCPTTWGEPTGLLITPLIRELIVHLAASPGPHRGRRHAESLLVALLEAAPSTTLHVPLPQDARVRAIADAVLADPADGRDLTAWADHAHSSVRTLTRLFARETGMTFAQWRTHVRIRAALGHLTAGRSVGATARAVGYRKLGAFSEAFHRVTGQHPRIYQPTGQQRPDRASPSASGCGSAEG